MTSGELTSGFDFWWRGPLRMAVMQIPIKIGAYIFIQFGVWAFPEIQDGGSRHHEFSNYVNLVIAVCW